MSERLKNEMSVEEARIANSFHITPDQEFDISTPRAQYEESFVGSPGQGEPEEEQPGSGKKFLNFTFTNLPNLHALTRETLLEKNSPRRP